MKACKNLAKLSKDELSDFFNSFDNVICDCDGVIFMAFKVLPGVPQGLNKLRELGKEIKYITNNDIITRQNMAERMTKQGVPTTPGEIVNPSSAIIDYLKSIKFDKKIYLLGAPGLREEIIDAGFKISNHEKVEVYQSYGDNTLDDLLYLDKDVNAIIMCLDFNYTFCSLNRAFRYLTSNPKMVFISTGNNQKVKVKPNEYILGPGYFQEMIEKASQKESIKLGKPFDEFGDHVKTKIFCDPSKTLFIGDSLEQDILFANKLGYQSLLVLSGTSTLKETANCAYDLKPDWYTDSLADFKKYIEKVAK